MIPRAHSAAAVSHASRSARISKFHIPPPPSHPPSSAPPKTHLQSPAKAGATCLRLIAQLVEDDVVDQMVQFVTDNIQSSNWRQRESAVMAFGAVLEVSWK